MTMENWGVMLSDCTCANRPAHAYPVSTETMKMSSAFIDIGWEGLTHDSAIRSDVICTCTLSSLHTCTTSLENVHQHGRPHHWLSMNVRDRQSCGLTLTYMDANLGMPPVATETHRKILCMHANILSVFKH